MQFSGIRHICKQLTRKEISVDQLIEGALLRAQQVDHLNAFISIGRNLPREERLNVRKTLNGITFALKDNYSTKVLPTTCASKILEEYTPSYDATVNDQLIRHGAILLGKTNMDQFAMGSGSVDSVFGPVKNPWTPGILDKNVHLSDWRITGGSSGGSAVAVATGTCVFAIGSDTGGSVRNPAAYCGVIGLKPTYGLVSRHGLISLVNSLDCPSIFARSVDDASIVLDAIKGRNSMDSTNIGTVTEDQDVNKSFEGLCVGIPKECLVHGMSPDVVEAWGWAADQFENAGARVIPVSLPHMRYSIVCYHVLCAAEVASNMARFDGLKYGYRSCVNSSSNAMMAVTRKSAFNDTVRNRILCGNYFLLGKNRNKYFKKAQKVRRLILDDYCKVFDTDKAYSQWKSTKYNTSSPKCDILLSPVVLSDAPLYSEFIKEDNRTRSAEEDILTQSANMAGVPAITVPTRLSSNRLPIGLQITGSHFSESVVLKASKYLEKVANFPTLQHQFEQTYACNPLKAVR